jgi:hypothetical protein
MDEECRICGKYRFFSWSPFEYQNGAAEVKTKTPTPLKDFTHWLLTYWKREKKEKPKKPGEKKAAKKATKTSKKTAQNYPTNRFIEMEAGADEMDYDSENDEPTSEDLEFIASDQEMGDDDYQHPNPYLTDFMPREMPIAEVPNEGPSTSQEINEEERRKRNYEEIRAVWEKLGVFKKDEENREAKKKEEEKEKEKERLKKERKANREVVTYAYSHFGQRYDNVTRINTKK